MSHSNRERAFWVGVAFVGLGMLQYGLNKLLGQPFGVLDLIWYLLPFGVGAGLMIPKYWAGIMATAANVVNQVFGKWRATP